MHTVPDPLADIQRVTVDYLKELIRRSEAGEIMFDEVHRQADSYEKYPVDGWRVYAATGHFNLRIGFWSKPCCE